MVYLPLAPGKPEANTVESLEGQSDGAQWVKTQNGNTYSVDPTNLAIAVVSHASECFQDEQDTRDTRNLMR